MNEPQQGKMYALTGGPDDKCIANGNTWSESEINDHEVSLRRFAERVESEQISRLHQENLASPINLENVKTRIKKGSKYTKVDIGSSGRFMVDRDGNIFGIRAYGQVNLNNRYGTLGTIDQYNWGNFYPIKKEW